MNAVAVFSKHGVVEFQEKEGNEGVEVRFSLTGFGPRETHAIHIHEFGDMRDGCKSLGGHYNPCSVSHGHHAGDLIMNFTTDSRGRFSHEYHNRNLHVKDILGRSVVIHDSTDDEGRKGRDVDGVFTPYREMKDTLLKTLCKGVRTKQERIVKLEMESGKNGNAGGRMDCGIIGLCI